MTVKSHDCEITHEQNICLFKCIITSGFNSYLDSWSIALVKLQYYILQQILYYK